MTRKAFTCVAAVTRPPLQRVIRWVSPTLSTAVRKYVAPPSRPLPVARAFRGLRRFAVGSRRSRARLAEGAAPRAQRGRTARRRVEQSLRLRSIPQHQHAIRGHEHLHFAAQRLVRARDDDEWRRWRDVRGDDQALRILETDRAAINAAYRDLIDLLLELDPSVDMRIANAIWYRNGFPFHQSFLDTVSHYFDARVAGLNFTDPATLTRINAWVDTATAGKIPKVLDAIDDGLVMLLMNAIYFKREAGGRNSIPTTPTTHRSRRNMGARTPRG